MTILEKDMTLLFSSNVNNILKDCHSINFWKGKWLGVEPFKELFSSLYAKSTEKDVVIAKMCSLVEYG
jgi:ABC-type polysaccharide transport system permease subunit